MTHHKLSEQAFFTIFKTTQYFTFNKWGLIWSSYRNFGIFSFFLNIENKMSSKITDFALRNKLKIRAHKNKIFLCLKSNLRYNSKAHRIIIFIWRTLWEKLLDILNNLRIWINSLTRLSIRLLEWLGIKFVHFANIISLL